MAHAQTVEGERPKLWKDPGFRRWVYGVAAAILVLLGGYGVIDAAQSANIERLIQAVLVVGPSAALGLAARKAETVSSDVTVIPDPQYISDGSDTEILDPQIGDDTGPQGAIAPPETR